MRMRILSDKQLKEVYEGQPDLLYIYTGNLVVEAGRCLFSSYVA